MIFTYEYSLCSAGAVLGRANVVKGYREGTTTFPLFDASQWKIEFFLLQFKKTTTLVFGSFETGMFPGGDDLCSLNSAFVLFI